MLWLKSSLPTTGNSWRKTGKGEPLKAPFRVLLTAT